MLCMQAAFAGAEEHSALGRANEMLRRFFQAQALRQSLARDRATRRLRDHTETARASDWRRLEREEADLRNQRLQREVESLQEQRERLAAEVEEGRREQDELTRKLETLSRTCEEQRARLSAQQQQQQSPAPVAIVVDKGAQPHNPSDAPLWSRLPVSSHPLCAV